MADELENFSGLSLDKMVDKFLDFMIQKFQASLEAHQVGTSAKATGALKRSFRKALIYSGGNVEQASLTFLYYGRFQDMGAGRGYSNGTKTGALAEKLYKKDIEAANGRTAKPWYSKIKTSQIKRFREILLDKYGKGLVIEIEKRLKGSVKIQT